MVRPTRLTIAAFVLFSSLACSDSAVAGPWFNRHDDPPPAAYPPIRYWAPTLARIGDCLHHPHLSVYPPDRHPEVPPTFDIIKFRRSATAPGDTTIEVPMAPETSKAK